VGAGSSRRPEERPSPACRRSCTWMPGMPAPSRAVLQAVWERRVLSSRYRHPPLVLHPQHSRSVPATTRARWEASRTRGCPPAATMHRDALAGPPSRRDRAPAAVARQCSGAVEDRVINRQG
jgi:hypothetical protein